jgi:hypothetical protein
MSYRIALILIFTATASVCEQLSIVDPVHTTGQEGRCSFGYDGVESLDQLREVSPFSDVLLLAPDAPSFRELLEAARSRDMQVGLAWDRVLFDTEQYPYRLRDDATARLAAVLAEVPRLASSTCFNLPVDEPYWNGIQPSEVDDATAILRAAMPTVPTLIVLAWPTLDTMTEAVPSDWVAFDRYYVRDPFNDPDYLFYWDRMKNLNPGKPIVVVADGFHTPAHQMAGIAPDEMGQVLRSYQLLFEAEPRAVALGVFRWSDSGNAAGARSLPSPTLREHIAVGSEITGKCGIPAMEDPLAGERILWLLQCRFYATIELDDPRTPLSAGWGRALSDESGYFWFFDESNVEATLKIIDGRAHNQHFWVFLSDMTDVNYVLRVRETESGALWLHPNEAGERPVVRDTSALPE